VDKGMFNIFRLRKIFY